MIVEQLTINGLKAHQHLEIDMSPQTLISGKNGAGKSTILEAISFLFGGGIMGESVDGRNMIALVNGVDGVSVEAVVKLCNQKARLRRWRTPTASGLSRSKTSVEMIEGCDDAAFHRALSGDLYGVSHVHEWLHLKWAKLRALIVDLGVDGIEDSIPDQVKELLDGQYTMDGLKTLEFSLNDELRGLKRDLKTVEQNANMMLDHMEPASAEELEELYREKRRLEAKMTELDGLRQAAVSVVMSTRQSVSDAQKNPVISGELSPEQARLMASFDEYVKPTEDQLASLNVEWVEVNYSIAATSDEIKRKQSDLTQLSQTHNLHQCPCCLQIVDEDFVERKTEQLTAELAKAQENLEFYQQVMESLKPQTESLKSKLAELRREHYEVLPLLSQAQNLPAIESLQKVLHEAEGEQARIEEQTGEVSNLIGENYGEIARIESILSQQKLLKQSETQMEQIKQDIVSRKTLLLSIESLLGVIARNGKARIEDRVKSYYGGSDLGIPTISLSDSQIGLQREDGPFYAGIALSGAEQDLLSTAIDCAIKDLQGIPKVVLLEGDSLDQQNLTSTMEQLGSMQAKGMVDQVVIATWADGAEALYQDGGWRLLPL